MMNLNNTLPQKLDTKYQSLRRIVEEMGAVLVAFSGGVDSTLLLKVATDAILGKVMAVTAISATTAADERRDAIQFAKLLNVRHECVVTSELEIDAFVNNPPEKCYICKKSRFGALVQLAKANQIPWVADGENQDDQQDYRPGSQASKELGIRSPLREAALTKQDVRAISKMLGLPSWDKPAYACLASRIPYGERITTEKLNRIDQAEAFIRQQCQIRQVRVRYEGDTARLEVETSDIPRFFDSAIRNRVVVRLKELGFKYVALDLEGYRMGSLNQRLKDRQNNPQE